MAARSQVQQHSRQHSNRLKQAIGLLSYIKQAVREKWKPVTRLNRYVKDARKPVAARYLQLKSGHAITAAHLMRIGKGESARCWWCGGRSETVAHLLLECRKWRGEQEAMVRKLRAKDIAISERRDRRNLKILFEDNDTMDMLEFTETTEVGKRLGAETKKVTHGIWNDSTRVRTRGERRCDGVE
jgi:hypothetical protein